MKVGDSVYCIKNIYSIDGKIKYDLFSMNKSYTIYNLRQGTHADGSKMYIVEFLNIFGGINSFYEGLHSEEYGNFSLFRDYFLTLREERKKKLDNINKINYEEVVL
jgi:hypothetical protein